MTHGTAVWWCELCALRAQLVHAEERAARIPEMRARIAELEGVERITWFGADEADA